ncbi:cytochrome c [Luteibacter aegosomatissinici]|uniref:cytochrome c n=1 Tax=Luteibacter aegosomatissinici TaxID=2911539 RepID=UPI001FFA2BA8|nr:cytochrome c [Luteibacter aegosomatissinici]UPG93219.1 cytochrome c [Luteibacter aegosomatissinici]
MRALLLVVLGLAIGALGATFAISALRQGTPFHDGVMAVMQHHMGALRANVRAKQCDAKASALRLGRLRQEAGDITEAFPGTDPAFSHAAGALSTALDSAIAAQPATCEALTAALKPVGDACSACHQQYR